MKNIKPRTLGILHRTLMVGGRSRLVVSPICFFELTTGRAIDETYGWQKIAPRLGPETVLDPVLPKHNAEVLLAGSACAPLGTRVTQTEVGLKIGAVDKRLRVWGDRKAVRGILPSSRFTDPEPFDEMPLLFSRAFGGPKFSINPSGKGHQTLRGRLTVAEVELPNIEPLRSSDPEPAGFGPLGLESPARRGHSGTYDDAWLKDEFPGFPSDLDRLFFNSAPVDQQQAQPWRGDEPFELSGMHPSLPLLAGRLPGLCARAFVEREGESPHEVSLHAETVWFFPHLDLTDMGLGDAGLGAVIFRGETEVEDSDALDVASVMIAYERLTDRPRSLAHYLRVHELRTSDPKTQLAHVLNDAPLCPVRTAEFERQLQQEQERALEEYYASFEAVTESILEENPELEKLEGYRPPECPPPKLGLLPKEAIARGDVDLTEVLAKADAWEKEAREEAAKKEAEAAEAMAKLPTDPSKKDPASAEAVAEAVAERVAKAMRQPRKFGGAGMGSGEGLPEIPEAAYDDPELQAVLELAAGAPSVAELEDDTRARRLDPKPEAIEEAHRVQVGQALRQTVERCLVAGRSLAGRDLAGADLSGMRLEAADLRELLLEHADLGKAVFVACRLEGSTLAHARLDGATFIDCDLAHANLCGARGAGAQFHGCDLSGGLWIESVWCGADFLNCGWKGVVANEMQAPSCRFDGSRFEETFLIQADLSHSSFDGCQGARTLLIQANMNSARLKGTSWERSIAVGIEGSGSSWDESTFDRMQFGGGSQLMGASFRGVQAKQSGFRGSPLGAAQLQNSVFESCDFGKVTLEGADLTGAAFFGSVLANAEIVDSDLREVRFYEALLNKVRIVDCQVADANFYGANCQGAVFQGVGDARLEGLNAAGVEVLQ